MPVEAAAVNEFGAEVLARACAQSQVPLVHFSTDYVFDGRAQAPYSVGAQTNPINAYGRSKAAGEDAIRRSGCDHLIIRTSWLYAPWGRNFVNTIDGLIATRSRITVVDDQYGRPTSVISLAQMTLQALERGARGTIHLCDDGIATWYELAREIATLKDSSCLVEPCTTSDYPTPAQRPRYSVLDIESSQSFICEVRHWRDQLAVTASELPHAA
jgi:dTDP-4-dehydrorhamnose reductase